MLALPSTITQYRYRARRGLRPAVASFCAPLAEDSGQPNAGSARNVIERLPKSLQASVRKALRQAWELDDADKAERLLRNLARRLEHEAPGVAASIYADREPPRASCRAQALARLYQLNRKYG